jgi:acylphosphatase
MKEKELLAIVSGNVQGVFYRRFIQVKAGELGITGTAKNVEDGTVEIVAQGKEEDLKKLLEFIYAGTEHAEVESANISWGPIRDGERMADFSIL